MIFIKPSECRVFLTLNTLPNPENPFPADCINCLLISLVIPIPLHTITEFSLQVSIFHTYCHARLSRNVAACVI